LKATETASPVSRHFSASLQPVEQELQEARIRFDELDLHPKSLKALRRQGLHKQTEIQEKSFDTILSGQDVVGRARTGTGKTLAFLLPSLEKIIRQKNPKPGVQMLVLSPTRELALQIAKEAERLVEQHDSSITSMVIYGGSSKDEEIHRFSTQAPTILVATPGRLKDHLAKTKLRRGIPFIDTVQNLQILVLDETDRLLDMGFRQEIRDILSCLPRKRQTLLFSATMPPNVRSVIASATNDGDYQLVDCIKDEDPATHTNAHTEQSHIVLPSDKFWTGSMELLLDLMEDKKSKIMVFFPMTSLVQLYAQLFQLRFGRRVLELHGRLHQRERTTVSGRFRNASKGVLFTSDVSARGVDYPNVTHVVQIGAAESRETYIHRLGRTGRAGKKGKGLLVLPQIEEHFLQDLDDLDLPLDERLQNQLTTPVPSKLLLDALGPVAQDVRAGKDGKLERTASVAYQAMIAYYYQRLHDRQETDEFVTTVNTLVQNLGLSELPPVDFYRARKIGIDTIPELNIQHTWKEKDWSSGWGDKPNKGKKPFGQPHGDFEGKFDQPKGRRKSGKESPDSARSRNRNRSSQDGSLDSARSRNRNRSSQDGSRSRSSGKFSRESESKEQFLKLGWKSGLTDTSAGGGSNARRKNKDFQRWDASKWI
jgi:ATP-dependent RNA helicase MSS116